MRILNILGLMLFISLNGSSQGLNDYFKIASDNNPGLQAKYKNFEASIKKVVQVSSLPDPTLSMGYFILPVQTRVGPQRARFSLSQMFPWFGTLKEQANVATLMAEAKYLEFIDSRNKLFYQVSAAYYPLYELHRFIAIEKENIEILSTYKDIATARFENGKGALVDVLRVDIMLKDATTNISILSQKKKPLVTHFNKLLNRNENDSIWISESLAVPVISQDLRRDSILGTNPLLDELDLKIRASRASEQVAIKQGLPKLGVGLDYVIVGQRSELSMPNNGWDALMPMVSVSIPIFRDKYTAAQEEAQIIQESYWLQKEDLSNRLTSSYEMIWFELQQNKDLIALYNQQIQTSNQSLSLLFSAYGNSGRDFEELLRMQQQILKYQKMKETAITNMHVTIAELDYITGKSK